MRRTLKIFLLVFIPIFIIGAGILGFFGIRSLLNARWRNVNGPLVMGAMRQPNRSVTINRTVNVNTDNLDQSYDDFLTNAVSSNKITSTQKDLITTERTLIQNSINDINNQQLTKVQRTNAVQKLKDSIYTWSSTNNIPLSYLGLNGMLGVEMMGIK